MQLYVELGRQKGDRIFQKPPPRQDITQPRHRLRLHALYYMGIDVHCKSYTGVPKSFRNDLGMYALPEGQTGKGMPQVVKPEGPKLSVGVNRL